MMTETLAPTDNGQMMQPDTLALMEQVVVQGDLAKLSPQDRLDYYRRVCESLRLNPYTQPFQYITLNNKLTLYARKDATDQLRRIHGISVSITAREKLDDLYVVTARAVTRDGRSDEAIGAVSLAGLRGEALANALMKCESKAKRRVTLSICGLGWTDETEIDSIPSAQAVRVDEHGVILDPPAALPAAASERGALIRRYGEAKTVAKRLGVSVGTLLPDMTTEDIAAAFEYLTDRITEAQAEQPASTAPPPEELATACEQCGKAVTPGQRTVSQKAFGGRTLCPDHQRAAKAAA